jgi:hypothetical protein
MLWVNRITIRRWVRKGKLKGEKVDWITLIPKQDVLAIAQRRGIEQVSEMRTDGMRYQDGKIGACQDGTSKPSSKWAAQS